MDKIDKKDSKFVVVGIFIIFGLILLIIIILPLSKNEKKSFNNVNLSLNKTTVITSGKNDVFQDKICNLSFKVPGNWQKSLTKLPLPQPPLTQAVFDENNKKSIFSYICYDEKYSFNQFNDSTDLKPEGIRVNNVDFTRVGNFVYFNKNNKLVIFQMFFTKNDIKPETGYEEKLMAVLGSIK